MFLFLPRLGGKTVSLKISRDNLQKELNFSNSTLYIYKRNSYFVKSKVRINISPGREFKLAKKGKYTELLLLCLFRASG